jgi:hypothetical protein
MTRNNSCWHLIDISGDILFNFVTVHGKEVAFVRMYGYVKGTAGAAPVMALRFIGYGPMAEIIYAHVQKGSRLFIISHVQQREGGGSLYTEFVIEECQYIRNVNWDAGIEKRKELVARGELRPSNNENMQEQAADA